jgi:putative transposase
MDLRNRIVQAVEEDGMSRRAAAERFMVSHSTAIKIVKRKETTGSAEPARIGGYRRHALEPHKDMLSAIIVETPDMTLAEIGDEIVSRGGPRVCKSSIVPSASRGAGR